MNESKDIKLSFVIPVYNSEKYLAKCIDSILSSNIKEIEVVLVDDGSTDSSGSICDRYASNDLRVSVVHKENGGVASARNAGLIESSGEYIFFVDNDDWINTEEISHLVDILLKTKVDLVVNKYLIVSDNGKSVGGNMFIDRAQVNGKSTKDVLEYFRKGRVNIMAPWEYVVKKDILTSNNILFDINQGGVDDSLFSPVLFCYCKTFYLNENAIYFWRQRRDSQGRSHNKRTYIEKMILTINALEKKAEICSESFMSEYLLFSAYKNIFSLFGPYYSYTREDRLFLDKWYYGHKSLIKKSVAYSGKLHRGLNFIFGNFNGIIFSYKMAVLKGIIYSYIYGHSTRIKE